MEKWLLVSMMLLSMRWMEGRVAFCIDLWWEVGTFCKATEGILREGSVMHTYTWVGGSYSVKVLRGDYGVGTLL